MPTTNSHPNLQKTKSRIRLRLGLTPPHPKAVKQPDLPVDSAHTEIASNTTTTATDPILVHQSTMFGTSLNNSTNTFSSHQSRNDSRDAFDFDLHDSLNTINAPVPPTLDVVSFATASSPTLARDAPEESRNSPAREIQHTQSHPNIAAAASADEVILMTDQELSDRFMFLSEIGFGNWGSVWLCKPKHWRSSAHHESGGFMKLGKMAAASGGSGAGGKVALKLVHRTKTMETVARVRALWGEMQIIRALRHEPHPSIIQFEAFVITPSYAFVVMPHLSHLIPVCLAPSRATPYFRQLASAVGYLHERGITHNDIKPANVMLSHNDIPVLVDFGFAQKWKVDTRGAFLSSISWGTPEYLDPQRARGMPHDERASDVWSLGITMFEILIGRTPFETNDMEHFSSPEELIVYYERTRKGVWMGQWSIPEDLQDLLRAMICPDPAYRITAMQAYHHTALLLSAPSVIITPHFVRMATSFDPEDEPLPSVPKKVSCEKKEKKRHTKRKEANRQSRASTPTALGESIKQHTSMSKLRPSIREGIKGLHLPEAIPSPKRGQLVIKQTKDEQMSDGGREDKENLDPTPTKVIKPAQQLPVKEALHTADESVVLRSPSAQLESYSHTNSDDSMGRDMNAISPAPQLESGLPTTSITALETREEAVNKAMRSLEGDRHAHPERARPSQRDVLGTISRPAPSPPRPRSLEAALSSPDVEKPVDPRRSLGLAYNPPGRLRSDVEGKVATSEVTSVMISTEQPMDVEITQSSDYLQPKASCEAMPNPSSPTIANVPAIPTEPSPGRLRHAIRPATIVAEGKTFPGSDLVGPLAELRDRILSSDQEKLVRFRQLSGTLSRSAKESRSTSRMGKTSMSPALAGSVVPQVSRPRSVEALALDGRLDKISLWIKDVERIVEDARKALADGHETPLPILSLPKEEVDQPTSPDCQLAEAKDETTGLLRPSSTQAEPATPPKWMSEEDAEREGELAADQGQKQEPEGRGKTDDPTVAHIPNLTGADEDHVSPTNTPEPMLSVPLKPPQLRGAPSTPALRSSTARDSRSFLARKSESNLRNLKFIAKTPAEHNAPSPRRVVYEKLLGAAPGVVRQGDGWTSFSSGRGMAKPASMASLRERAIAFLRDDREPKETRHIVDLAAEVRERRPDTPGTTSVLNLGKGGIEVQGKKKGFLGRLKGMVNGKGKAADNA